MTLLKGLLGLRDTDLPADVTEQAERSGWKGARAGQRTQRDWMPRMHGKATCCQSPECAGKSQLFGWICIVRPWLGYTRDFRDYIQLCRSCHKQVDFALKFHRQTLPVWLRLRLQTRLEAGKPVIGQLLTNI